MLTIQALTPMTAKPGMPAKPGGLTPHALGASRLGGSVLPGHGLYQPLDVNMGMLDPLDSIPAHFGNGNTGGGYPGQLGLQSDDSTLELRRDMLRTRCNGYNHFCLMLFTAFACACLCACMCMCVWVHVHVFVPVCPQSKLKKPYAAGSYGCQADSCRHPWQCRSLQNLA